MTEHIDLAIAGTHYANKTTFIENCLDESGRYANAERAFSSGYTTGFIVWLLTIQDNHNLLFLETPDNRFFDMQWEKDFFSLFSAFSGYVILWTNRQIFLSNSMYEMEREKYRELVQSTPYPYVLAIDEHISEETITRTSDEWRDYLGFPLETKVLMGSVLDKSFALTVVIELLKLNPPSELIQKAIAKLESLKQA